MEICFFKDAVYYLRHNCEDTVTIEVTKTSTCYEPMVAAEISTCYEPMIAAEIGRDFEPFD